MILNIILIHLASTYLVSGLVFGIGFYYYNKDIYYLKRILGSIVITLFWMPVFAEVFVSTLDYTDL